MDIPKPAQATGLIREVKKKKKKKTPSECHIMISTDLNCLLLYTYRFCAQQ